MGKQKDFVSEVYESISSNDPTFEKDVPFDVFQKSMTTDAAYRKQVYGSIASLDPTYEKDVPYEKFEVSLLGDPQKKNGLQSTSPSESRQSGGVGSGVSGGVQKTASNGTPDPSGNTSGTGDVTFQEGKAGVPAVKAPNALDEKAEALFKQKTGKGFGEMLQLPTDRIVLEYLDARTGGNIIEMMQQGGTEKVAEIKKKYQPVIDEIESIKSVNQSDSWKIMEAQKVLDKAITFGGGVDSPRDPSIPSSLPERLTEDITQMKAAPTKELLNNYINSAFEDLRASGSMYAQSEAQQASQAIAGLEPEIEKIRQSDKGDEAKFLDVQRFVADNIDPQLSSAHGAVLDKMMASERAVQETNPEMYRKVLDGRVLDKADKLGLDPRTYRLSLMENSIPQVFTDIDAGEAKLVMEKEAVKGSILDSKRAPWMSDSDWKEFQGKKRAEIEALDSQINEVKNLRLSGYQSKITELDKQIASAPAGEVEALKEERDLLKKQMDGFMNPQKQMAQVMAVHGEEVNKMEGETQMDKLRNYYASLVNELNYLSGKVADKGVTGMVGETIGGASAVTDRINELNTTIATLAPVAFFNEAPRKGTEGFFGSAAKGFVKGLTPDVWESQISGFGEWEGSKEKAMVFMESLSNAGINPDILDPDRMKAVKADADKKKNYQTSEFWGDLLGGSLSMAVQIGVGNKAMPVKSLADLWKGTKLMKYLGGAVDSGISYQKAGMIFGDNAEELNFTGGFFGGIGSGLIPTGSMRKEAVNAVTRTFGDKAKDAAIAMMRGGAKRVGAGTGETLEELGNTLGNIFNESDTGQTLLGALHKQFPDMDATLDFMIGSFVSGAIMSGGHGATQNSDAVKSLNAAGAKKYQEATPEQRALFDKIANVLGEDGVTISQNLRSAAESGEAVAGKETTAKAKPVDPNAIGEKHNVSVSVNMETGETVVTPNEGTTPEQVEAAKAELAEGGIEVSEAVEPVAEEVAVEGIEPAVETEKQVSQPVVSAPADPLMEKAAALDTDIDDLSIFETEDIDFRDEAAIETAIQGKQKPTETSTIEDTSPTAEWDIEPKSEEAKAAETLENPKSSAKEKQKAKATLTKAGIPVTEEGKIVPKQKAEKVKKQAAKVQKAVEKPAAERTVEETTEVLSAPQVPAEVKQEAIKADDKRVDNIAASIEGKTPAKVKLVVDGKEQIGAVTKVYTHPKSGKEVYTVTTTDSKGKETTQDVLAHMADVSEWNEAAPKVEPATPLTEKETISISERVKKLDPYESQGYRADDLQSTKSFLEKNPEAARKAFEIYDAYERIFPQVSEIKEIKAKSPLAFIQKLLQYDSIQDLISSEINGRKSSIDGNKEMISKLGNSKSDKEVKKDYESAIERSEAEIARLENLLKEEQSTPVTETKAEGQKPAVNEALKDVESTAKALESVDGVIKKVIDSQARKGGEDIVYMPNIDIINRIKSSKIGDDLILDVAVDKYLYGNDSEPFPSTKHSDGFKPKAKRDITEPINIFIESIENPFIEAVDGNHRIVQARFNKDKFIPAKLTITEDLKEQADNFNANTSVSEAYHKAKADGSNPELVKAVEDLLSEAPKPASPTGSQKIKKAYDKWRDAATDFGTMMNLAGIAALGASAYSAITGSEGAAEFGVMAASLGGLNTDPKAQAAKLKKLFEATVELGKEVYDAGYTEAAAWTKKMVELAGDKYKPMLPKVFKAVQEDIEKAVSKPAEPIKEETKKEGESTKKGEGDKKETKPRVVTDPLSTTGETRQRGLEQTLLKHGQTFGDFLTDLIKESPTFYEKMDFEEVVEVAKNRIEEEGLADLHKTLTTKGNIDPVVVAMQGLAIQMYAKMGDNAYKAGDKAAATKFHDILDEITQAAGADATQRGQANGIIGQFGLFAPTMDSYLQTRYDKLIADVMKQKDSKGKTTKEKTSEAAKDLNKAKKEKANDIADAVVTSKEVSEVKADPKRESIKKNLAAAKAEYNSIRVGDALSMGGLGGIGRFTQKGIAATKLGYWTVLDGAYKLSDFVKRMKAAGVTDDDLINDIWENGEYNGTKLSELADQEMKRASAETVTKAVGAEKKTPSESAKAKAEYTKAIRDTIAKHLSNPDGRTLENVLVEDLAMSPADAAKVSGAVAGKTLEMIGGSIERAANSVKNNSASKIVAKRLADALVDGDLTPESVAEKMAKQLGLPADLTPEMKRDLRDKAMAIRNTTEGSKVRHSAEWAFAKAAAEALKHIDKNKGVLSRLTTTIFKIYTSLVYAGMLNGLPTHAKNFLSVMPAVLSFGTGNLLNTVKWARAAKRAHDYKGNLPKKLVFFYNSPVYEFFFRWKHGFGSMKSAGLEAIDVLRTGKGEYRWEDEVKQGKDAFNQIVESLPVLERTRFYGGKWNPYNHVFGKLVGRALSTTDALTSLYYENQEVAFALVGAGLESGMTMDQINTKMNQFFTKNSPKWQESMAEAEAEAEVARKFGVEIKPSTIKAEAARLMREKVKTEFAISKERGADLRAVAKDKIYAHKRHGIIGQLAAALGNAGNSGGKRGLIERAGKAAIKPIVPFTNIVGNMGDALLDTLPVYGIARANGWSGTAIAARLYNKTHGGTFFGNISDNKTAMMGKRVSFNDDLYVQQLSRAVGGTLAAVALAMLTGDDDDDFISFSGEVKGDPSKSYKIKIFGEEKYDYRMIPGLYLPIRLVQASKEYLKQPQNKGKYIEAIATGYWASVYSIKDMSFLGGVADFIESFSRASQSFESSTSDISKLTGTFNTVTKGLLSQHINFALKPWIGNQAIIKNIEKVFSPEQEGSQDFGERMYYLIGLQSVMGNEKKVDLAGNVIKSLPGDDVFPLSVWFELNDASKKVNKVSHEQGIKPIWPPDKIRTFNQPDPESGNPFTQRKMTPEEYFKVQVRAGQLYAEKVVDYIDGNSRNSNGQIRKYSNDKDIEFKETDGKSIPRAKKILDGFRGYAWGAALKELFGEQVLTQDELNEILGQDDL